MPAFLLISISSLVIALIAIWRVGPEPAVPAVVLPVPMLWPYGTGWKFKGVELDIMDAVALPVALALVFNGVHASADAPAAARADSRVLRAGSL
jgi:hypothetical protein